MITKLKDRPEGNNSARVFRLELDSPDYDLLVTCAQQWSLAVAHDNVRPYVTCIVAEPAIELLERDCMSLGALWEEHG